MSMKLGYLSKKFGSGNRGPLTISTGIGDKGGRRYGTYQMTSQTLVPIDGKSKKKNGTAGKSKKKVGTAGTFEKKEGTVHEFLEYLKKNYSNNPEFEWINGFNGFIPGTNDFNVQWKKIVAANYENFKKIEYDFIKETHYDPQVEKIRIKTKFDIDKMSPVVQKVVFSTAVQHGQVNTIISEILNNLLKEGEIDQDFEKEKKLIEAIYEKRGGKNRFRSSSNDMQAGVAKRFIEEEELALKMLEEYYKNKPAQEKEKKETKEDFQRLTKKTDTINERLSEYKEQKEDPKSYEKELQSLVLPCLKELNNSKEKQEKKEETASIVLHCEHLKRKYSSLIPYLELVPKNDTFTEKHIDTLTIIWQGKDYPGNVFVEPNLDVGPKGTYKIKIPYEHKSNVPSLSSTDDILEKTKIFLWSVFDSIWTYRHIPTEYTIKGLPYGNLAVKIYNPDKYKLSIKIPYIEPTSLGWKMGEGIQGIKAEKEIKSEPKNPISKSDSFIVLERNNSPLKIDALDSLAFVISLISTVWGLILKLKKIPKVGWYINYDLNFFQGIFELEWGWKEYSDYRAFYWFKINLALKLIEGKLELGIGFQGPGFTAQIFGAINGEIPIYFSFEKTGPEEFENIPIGIKREIKGELGALLEAHYILKVQSTIETKISAKPEIFVNKIKGLHGRIIISWSGIEAKIVCGVGEGGFISSKEGFSEKKYTIMPGDPELKCIQFPPEAMIFIIWYLNH